MFKARVLAGLCWFAAGLAWAAPEEFQGLPFVKRFGTSDYRGSPDNGDLATSEDGYLYLANRRGLLRYDGSRWASMKLPGDNGAYAVVPGADGQIYVGGYQSFGRLGSDDSGAMLFEDLSEGFELDEANADFGVVAEILPTPAAVYFRSAGHLFSVGRDGRRQHWPLADTVRRMFVADDRLLARVNGVGLSEWRDGQFVLLPGGERFAAVGIASILPRDSGPLVVSDDGFYRVHSRGIEEVAGAEQSALRDYEPNTALPTSDGGILVGSASGELLHFDRALHLRAAHPLGRQAIQAMATDREGGTWIAADSGLARVEVPSRWASYGEVHGLFGEPRDTAFHADSLWVASSDGVYRGRAERRKVRFERIREGAAYALQADAAGLLVIDDDGVLLLREGQQPQRVLSATSAFAIQPSLFHPDRSFVFTLEEIVLLQRAVNGWSERARWSIAEVDSETLVEVAPDRFWINDYGGGPQRWRWDPATATVLERTVFDEASGLTIDADYGTSLAWLDDTLYAISGKAVFEWREDRFQPSEDAPFSLVDEPAGLTLTETAEGDFAYDDRQLFRRAPGSAEWQRLHLGDAAAQGFGPVRLDADGKLRISSWAGVLQFDASVPEREPPQLRVNLYRAQREAGDGREVDLAARVSEGIALPPDHVLRLTFGMGSLESPSEIRYRVKGLISSWSPWTPGEAQLALRYPGPGRFVLEVQGRTLNGREALPLRLDIRAPPRWWQTPLVQLVGVLLASAITLLLSRRFLRYRQERDAALEAANTDPLTGALNRRAAQARLRGMAAKSRGRPVTFAVLFADIDHFKTINDRYGHAAGDGCLKAVAERVRSELRGGDALARWGGEEFLCLLDGASAADAHRIAERIRLRVADGVVSVDGQAIAVTVSLGVAIYGGDDTLDKLVARADAALYEAKRSGRNRVMPALAALQA